jgi:hypothetical protein
MLLKQLAASLGALAGLLLAGTARAEEDTIRLKLTDSSAATKTLQGSDADLDADLIAVARGFGGRGFGGRGFGGFRGIGGFRGWGWGGFVSPSWGIGYGGNAVTVVAPSTLALEPDPADYTQPSDGTFPYDGGPRRPIPMPGSGVEPGESVPAPNLDPPASHKPTPNSPDRLKASERYVSLPAKKKGKWQYPAYGEKPRRAGGKGH